MVSSHAAHLYSALQSSQFGGTISIRKRYHHPAPQIGGREDLQGACGCVQVKPADCQEDVDDKLWILTIIVMYFYLDRSRVHTRFMVKWTYGLPVDGMARIIPSKAPEKWPRSVEMVNTRSVSFWAMNVR